MARVNLSASLPGWKAKGLWEARRYAGVFARRFGWAGYAAAAALILSAVAGIQIWSDSAKAKRLASELSAMKRQPAGDVSDRTRLQAFDAYLLSREEIPAVLEGLIGAAKSEGLRLTRGEYSAEADPAGGFLRYRMTLPVKGNAGAIYRFMLGALKANRTLALETVEFKRETIGSSAVEARIQWSVLTRLNDQKRARAGAPNLPEKEASL